MTNTKRCLSTVIVIISTLLQPALSNAEGTDAAQQSALSKQAAASSASETTPDNSLEQLDIDHFTGSVKLVLPIWLPHPPADIPFDLKLIYASLSTRGWLGPGWTLNLPTINRALFDQFATYSPEDLLNILTYTTPQQHRWQDQKRDSAADTYIFYTGGASMRLTHIGNNEYRLSDSSVHYRLKYDDGTDSWSAITPQGVTYSFRDTYNPKEDNFDKPVQWRLTSITSKNGNELKLTYSDDRIEIFYCPIDEADDFYYRIRIDLEKDASSETAFEGTDRIKSLTVLCNGQITRKYDFTYQSSYSMLEKITESGPSDSQINPPITFSYEFSTPYQSSRTYTLLTKIENGIGGSTQIDYRMVAAYEFSLLAGQSLWPPPTQSPSYPVAAKVTRSDGRGSDYITRYTYQDALYDREQKRFRGFGYVFKVDDRGTVTETWFLQSDALMGRVARQRISTAAIVQPKNIPACQDRCNYYPDGSSYGYNNLGGTPLKNYLAFVDSERILSPSKEKKITQCVNTYGTSLYKEISNTWEYKTPYPGVNIPFMAETVEKTCDGDDICKTRTITYRHDEYGNPVNTTIDADGSIHITETEYLYNTADWLIGYPCHTRILGKTGDVLKERWIYYDNAVDCKTPPTKGLTTRIENDLYDPLTGIHRKTVISNEYDSYGNLTKTTDSMGRRSTVEYDNTVHMYPVRTVDPLGFVTTSTYDYTTGSMLSLTDANNRTTRKTYDVFGRLKSVIGPLDSESAPAATYEYSFTSRPVCVTKRMKLTHEQQTRYIKTKYYYDGLGRLIQTTTSADPATNGSKSIVADVTRYDSGNRPIEEFLPWYTENASSIGVLPAEKRSLKYQYDCLGRLTSTTYPDGTETTTRYHDRNITSVDANGHAVTSYADHAGNTYLVEERNGRSLYQTRYEYNELNQLTTLIDNAGNRSYFTWDSGGRKLRMITPSIGEWNYTYDLAGNITKQTDPRGISLSFEYDNGNRITTRKSDTATLAEYTYDLSSRTDSKGRLSTVKDKLGKTDYFYDAEGKTIKIIRTIANAGEYTFTKTYNAAGNVHTVTYPNGTVITYGYDDLGRLSNISGSSGTGSTAYLSAVEYSADGQITRLTYGNGVETSYTYDNLSSRLTRITTRSGTTLLLDKSYKFDKAGNITTITDEISGNIQSFVYDDLSRLTSSAGTRGTTTYSYDSLGNLTSKDGVTYDYSPAYPHRVTGLSDGTSFEYDKAGNLVTMSKNGINKSITYDQNNRITRIQSGSGSAHLGHFRLQLLPGDNFISLPVVPEKSDINAVFTSIRNKRGQIAHWNPSGDDYLYNVNDPSYDQITDLEYGKGYWVEINSIYDDEILVDGSAPTSSSLSLNKGWNAIGMPAPVPMPVETALAPLALGTDYSRILQYEAGSNGTFREYSASKQEFTQMIPGRGYWIDMLRDTTWKITNSTAASNVVTEFAYDAEGRRVKKTENGQTILWPDQTYQAGPDGQITIHLFMGTAPLCSVTTDKQNNSTVSYYHNDHLGSSTVVTDASGAVIEQSIYEPFGSVTTTGVLQDTPETAWHYTGKELDDSTGLYYFGARYYDPGLGRFIQPDPVIQSIFDSQTLNPYAYCRNNPLILIDPSGMSFDSFDGGSGSFGSSFGNDFGGSLWDESWDYTSTTGSYSYTQSYTSAGVTTVFGWEGAWSSINSMTTGSMDSFGNLSNPLAPLFTGAAQMAGPSLAVAGMFNEPLDWATTLYQFSQGKATWKDLAWMATPFVSAGIMRAADGVKDMARMARETQLSSGYAADVWKNVTLPKGTIIYQGAPGASGFFTTHRALTKSSYSIDAIWNGLQVQEHLELGYRKTLVAYELLDDTTAAFGIARANTRSGTGGYGQIFIDRDKAQLRELFSVQLN